MKKIYLSLFAAFFVWQAEAQVLNQSAGWPNPAWTITGVYNSDPLAFEANPTTTANFAFDDDDAGNPSDDSIAAESPIINLTAAHAAGEQILRVSVSYGYRYLANDVLRFEYWNADTSTWVAWGGNIPGNYTDFAITDNFCTIPKTSFTTADLDISDFTATQLSGFRYRIYYNDDLAEDDWNWGFCFNSPTITSSSAPIIAPSCAINPTPANGATGIPAFSPLTISWDIPTSGDPVTTYEIYFGDSPETLELAGTVNSNAPIVAGTVGLYSTTVYWQVIAINNGGEAVGCAVWSFTTEDSPGFCLNGNLYPEDPYSPETCDGTTENVITEFGYAGEYSLVSVVSGRTYVFSSSNPTDFITISTDDGETAEVFGTTPLTWVADVDGDIRFYTHLSDNCEIEEEDRVRSVTCTIPSDILDYANLQWPPTATITQGNTVTVYAQAYEAGLTDTTSGQAPGITAWVGLSETNTNPNTWTEWFPATFNVESGNNDEYMAAVGNTLTPGTYYYATRFRLNGGDFVYGGINASAPNNGNFWDGATFGSGVLTVQPAPAPANDDCSGAVTLNVDDSFCNGTNTNGTNLGATDSGVAVAECFNYGLNDVWFSFTVPANVATVDISTDFLGGTLYDTEIALYSGACGALTELDCDNDSGTVEQPNGFSWNSLIEDTPVNVGQTYYVRVSGYDEEWVGTFCLRIATNQTLSNNEFDSANFKSYPNPVRNILNVSYNKEISSVEVFNLLGQKVMNTSLKANDGQIDMSSLAAGAYMVKVTSEGNSKTIKVIKE